MKPFLSIVIPAYNESKRLPLTLIDIDKRLSERDYSYEIIVVNDGSVDSTAEIVTRFSKLIKNLRLIDNSENHGKGWVVRQGMLAAKGNLRLFTDADNSTSIDQFDTMLPFFKQGFDVVFGSRGVKGAKLEPAQPWYRQIVGKAGNLIIQLFLLRGIKDSQCGFKCFNEDSAEEIFKRTTIDRWGFDIEALVLAKLLSFRMKEMPVRWVNDTHSTVGWKAYVSTLFDVLRIKLRLAFKKYDLSR